MKIKSKRHAIYVPFKIVYNAQAKHNAFNVIHLHLLLIYNQIYKNA